MSRFNRKRKRQNADKSSQPTVKRQDRPSSADGASSAASEGDNLELTGPQVHVPKPKYAIAFGYVGSAYHGFQVQGGAQKETMDTVEGRLLEALFAAGAIHEAHRNLLSKLQLSKASRTDKGVHAACTYVAGRFELSNYSAGEPTVSREDAFVAKLNELLPDDIRCYRALRVTRGFCARSMCSMRKYEYVIPNWLLRKRYVLDGDMKRTAFSELSEKMESHLFSSSHTSSLNHGRSDAWEGTTEERDMDLDLLQDILHDFCGTHDFHNFTPRQKGMENSTKRFIHEIKVEKRSVQGCTEDIVAVAIIGQSFVYNQIRKMMSLAYEVYLGTAPRHSIRFSLSKRHVVQTALAPAEGLFLQNPFFEAYNKRCNPPQTPMILYDDVEPMVEQFKTTHVYPAIMESIEGDIWSTWLSRIVQNPFFLENQDFHVSGSE